MTFEGTEQFDKILNCGSPKQAKDLGQSRATPIRQDWDIVKEAMLESSNKCNTLTSKDL